MELTTRVTNIVITFQLSASLSHTHQHTQTETQTNTPTHPLFHFLKTPHVLTIFSLDLDLLFVQVT